MGDLIKLFGFGSGGIKPIGNSMDGMKSGQVLRKIDFKGKRFSRSNVDKMLVGGVMNAKMITTEKGSKQNVVHEKLKAENVIDLMRKKYIGKTKGQIERMIRNEQGIRIEDHGKRIDYKLEGKNRKILDDIATGVDGPSREEIAADLKKQERFRRLNVLGVQRSREKEDMAWHLQDKRRGGLKKSIDIRNDDNTKIGARNIGVSAGGSTVSMLSRTSKVTAGNVEQPGFAGTAPKKANEKTPSNVVSLDAHKEAKGISSVPFSRTGTDG